MNQGQASQLAVRAPGTLLLSASSLGEHSRTLAQATNLSSGVGLAGQGDDDAGIRVGVFAVDARDGEVWA